MGNDQEPVGGTVVEQKSATVIPNRKTKSEKGPYVVGSIILSIYFGTALLMIFVNIQKGSESAIHELTTTLRDALMMFVMWIYGTTKSGDRKTEIIAKSGPVDPH